MHVQPRPELPKEWPELSVMPVPPEPKPTKQVDDPCGVASSMPPLVQPGAIITGSKRESNTARFMRELTSLPDRGERGTNTEGCPQPSATLPSCRSLFSPTSTCCPLFSGDA